MKKKYNKRLAFKMNCRGCDTDVFINFNFLRTPPCVNLYAFSIHRPLRNAQIKLLKNFAVQELSILKDTVGKT